MARKMVIILSIVAALAFLPTLAMADSFGLSGPSVAGTTHDDQGGTQGAYFKLKWHDVTNAGVGTGTEFGMADFDMRGIVGSTLVNQSLADTTAGQTFTGSLAVAFWLDTNPPSGLYPDPATLGSPTGYINLSSITFSKETIGGHDLITLSGQIIGMAAAQVGLANGMGFELIATSKNNSAQNDYAAKYNDWVSGDSQGSGSVPFGLVSATTSAATPEPGTMLLLGSSLGLMGFLRRRRKAEELAA